jgi:hypothetical protein
VFHDRAASPTAPADLVNGTAALLFETVKSVQLGFHSRLGEVIARLIEVVEEDEGSVWSVRFGIAKSILVRICEHCRVEQADAMWTSLFDVIDSVLDGDDKAVHTSIRLRNAVYLMAVCVAHRGGSRLRDAKPMLERIGRMTKNLLAHEDADATCVSACVSLVNVVLRVADTDQIRRAESSWTPVFGLKNTGVVLAVCSQLCEHQAFAELYQQRVLTTCQLNASAGDVASSLALLDCIPRSQRCSIPEGVVQHAMTIVQQASSETASVSPELAWLALRCVERCPRQALVHQGFDKVLETMFDKLLPLARQEIRASLDVSVQGKDAETVLRADKSSAAQLTRTAHVMLQALAGRFALYSAMREDENSTSKSNKLNGSKQNKSGKGSGKGTVEGKRQAEGAGDVQVDDKVVCMMREVLESFPHSAQVLDVVLPFFKENSRHIGKQYSLENLVDTLAVNLSSADDVLRNATLQLLVAITPESEPTAMSEEGVREKHVLELLLTIENAPADAINGKMRNIKLLQLQTDIEYGKIPVVMRKLLLPFLVGQLRNRFTMPWPAAVECIGMLSSVHPEATWSQLLGYLGAYVTHGCPHKSICEASQVDMEEDKDKAEREKEARKGRIGKARAKEERVPIAEDVTVRPLEGENFASRRFISVALSHSFAGSTCVDATVQLLKAAGKQPMYVQNHSQPFVALFLSFLAHQYDPLFEEDTSVLGAKALDAVQQVKYATITRTEATKVLLGYLDLFAQMTSVNPLHKAHELRDIFTRLLTKTHSSVQLQALRCLCVWGDEGIVTYKKNLENIVDDIKYRHELSLFQV